MKSDLDAIDQYRVDANKRKKDARKAAIGAGTASESYGAVVSIALIGSRSFPADFSVWIGKPPNTP